MNIKTFYLLARITRHTGWSVLLYMYVFNRIQRRAAVKQLKSTRKPEKKNKKQKTGRRSFFGAVDLTRRLPHHSVTHITLYVSSMFRTVSKKTFKSIPVCESIYLNNLFLTTLLQVQWQKPSSSYGSSYLRKSVYKTRTK